MRAGSAYPIRIRQRGFTLLALMGVVVVTSLAAAAAGPIWSQLQRREREAELLRVGVLYARALASYRDTFPGAVRSYPRSLEELARDPRTRELRRHLRRLYPDPIDPRHGWATVRDEYGRIVGVHSVSDQEPLQRGSIALPAVKRYSDWKFMAVPASATGAQQ